MNVKQAIRELQRLERQRMAAIQSGQDADEARADEMIGLIQAALEAWVDMAEAAIELARIVRDVSSKRGG